MMKPDSQAVKNLAMAVRQYPELLEWLESTLAQELKRLPYAIEHPAVFQGRCQMLSELIEFMKEFPTIAAKF